MVRYRAARAAKNVGSVVQRTIILKQMNKNANFAPSGPKPIKFAEDCGIGAIRTHTKFQTSSTKTVEAVSICNFAQNRVLLTDWLIIG